MSIGEKIDKLWVLRAERLAHEKLADELKKEETALQAELVADCKEVEISAAKGTKASFSYIYNTIGQVTEWDPLYDFIAKNQAFELLHKRLSTTAWAEHFERGILVPGTATFEQLKVSLTKIGRS